LQAKPHILVVPSEEYVPEQSPLAGIFQRHQIGALREHTDYCIGIVSVKLVYSVAMILKAIIFDLIGKKVSNNLANKSLMVKLSLLANKLFHPEKFIRCYSVDGSNVVAIEGLYMLPPSPQTDHSSWIRAGKVAVNYYITQFGRPDIIHAHNSVNAGMLAVELKKSLGIPYVLTEHSSYFYQNLIPHKLFSRVSDAIFMASKFLVVSPRLKKTLEEKLGNVAGGAEFVPNVLPPLFEQDDQLITRKHCPSAPFIFLCVGNLLSVKGHEFLLEAFASFCGTENHAILKIIGNGPLLEELRCLTVSYGIEDKVFFLGELPQDSVKSAMLSADVLVLPSKFETFGVVLIEALSCGLPVVATSCGGPDVIVDEESGILVTPEDSAALSDGLSWAFTYAHEMSPGIIRAHAVARFGGEAFSNKMIKIYQKILGEYEH